MLIDVTMLLGLINFYIGGYAGAGIILFLTAVTFSALFLKTRYAIIRIVLCVIIMCTMAFMYSTNTIVAQINIDSGLQSGLSWSVAIVLFGLISILFAYIYTVINKSLINKINDIKESERELSEANSQLQDLLKQNESTNKQLIIALEKAKESNNLKTEFLHNMSHEVKTPLNGIVGFSRLLRKKGITEQKREEFIEIIISSSNKLQKVIDDIVEISILNAKQQSLSLSEININKLLSELHAIFLLRIKRSVSLILKSDTSTENLTIESDPHALTKILGNIIENAIKFTDKGSIEIGYTDENDSIIIYVKDTGIGIPDNKKALIFERFSQASTNISDKYGGLGLGLSIAKENTAILSGTVYLESNNDVGTTFYIKLPKTIPEAIKNELIMDKQRQ
jgi:signal transduction histidine kinase